MIKAVVFDFGGVLVKTDDPTGRVKWENRLGLPPGGLSRIVFDSPESSQATLGQVPYTAVWEHVGQALSLPPADVNQLRQDFFGGDHLDQELVAFLQGLRPRYKTGILSNAYSDGRKVIETTYQLGKAVDIIIISAEEKMAKPAPAIFQLACSRLGVSPEEMVFVDDFLANVKGAQSIGIRAYQYTSTRELLSELKLVLY